MAAAKRQGLLAGRAALGVPGSLGDLLRERLSELSPPGLDAILLVATSSQATAWLIEKAAGGSEGLDEAVREGVLEVDGERLRFTHPLIGSVAYGLASPDERRRAHRRIADATPDPRRRHGSWDSPRRVPTRPSPRCSTKRRRRPPPAEARSGRGALRARCDAHAHRSENTRDRRLFEAAKHSVLVGDVKQGRSLLRDLVDNSLPGAARARALLALVDIEADTVRARKLANARCRRPGRTRGCSPMAIARWPSC